MVGASGFEIRLERVGESLQITSAMLTYRYLTNPHISNV